ncbi:MAG: cupin domain-containing protein [Granulosicoccus sp.]
MTLTQIDTTSSAAFSTLPQWFSEQLQPLNTDFDTRVVCLAEDARWLQTSLTGVKMRVMEYIPGPRPRLALQLRLNYQHSPIVLNNYPDLEILIQQGHIRSRLGHYRANQYLRLPQTTDENVRELVCQRAESMDPSEPVLLYLAVGQMRDSDTEWRRINTTDEDNWFPGPAEGTDVLPLHGHGLGNVMLVRWNKTMAFKTRIDPRGEEVLVVKGAVYDAQGFYPAGSWIRNPIVAWQSWGAKSGTVIYYKNGHFNDSDSRL